MVGYISYGNSHRQEINLQMKIVVKDRRYVTKSEIISKEFDISSLTSQYTKDAQMYETKAIMEWLSAKNIEEARDLLQKLNEKGFKVQIVAEPPTLKTSSDASNDLYIYQIRIEYNIKLISKSDSSKKEK